MLLELPSTVTTQSGPWRAYANCSAQSEAVSSQSRAKSVISVFFGLADKMFGERLRDAFLAEADFAMRGEAQIDASVIAPVVEALPDLLILEMRAPTINVLRFCETLKQILPKLHVFVVTDQGCAEVEKQASRVGVDAVFHKDEISSLVYERESGLRITESTDSKKFDDER